MKDERKDFIPKKLQQLRLASRMTQSKLASALNISRSCLANYETGMRSPDAEIIESMADFYNVESSYFTKEDIAVLSGNNTSQTTNNVIKEMIITGNLPLDNISLTSRIALYEYYNYLLKESSQTQ